MFREKINCRYIHHGNSLCLSMHRPEEIGMVLVMNEKIKYENETQERVSRCGVGGTVLCVLGGIILLVAVALREILEWYEENYEMDLMELLILNEGKELTTPQILDKVWKDDRQTEEGVVWMYISYLKSKLDAVNASLVISGEKGGPYRLEETAWRES